MSINQPIVGRALVGGHDPLVVSTWDARPLDQPPGTLIAVSDEGGRLYRLLVQDTISTGLLAAGSREYILADLYPYAVEWYQALPGDVVPAAAGEVWEGNTTFGGGSGTITTDGEWLTLSAPSASGSPNDYAALFTPHTTPGSRPAGQQEPQAGDGLYYQFSFQVTGVPTVLDEFSILADADNDQRNFRLSFSLTATGDPRLTNGAKVGMSVDQDHVAAPKRVIVVHAPDLLGASYVFSGDQVKPIAAAEEADFGASVPNNYFGLQANPTSGDNTQFRVKDIWCARLATTIQRPL